MASSLPKAVRKPHCYRLTHSRMSYTHTHRTLSSLTWLKELDAASACTSQTSLKCPSRESVLHNAQEWHHAVTTSLQQAQGDMLPQLMHP